MDETANVRITGHSRVEIVGSREHRPIAHVGNDLVPGETTYELELSFSNGAKHMAKVSEEAFKTYLEVSGLSSK